VSLTQTAPRFASLVTEPRTRPIGVFDSGVGGLTVLAALREVLPGESLIYLGDTARLPYGTKSFSTVTRYAIQAARVLVDQGIKLLVVACNTASALALDDLAIEFYDVPVIGVLRPGADAACLGSTTGRIAVIATESTTSHGAYEREIRRIRPDARVVSRACSLFVALVEEGWTKGPIVRAVAHEYLDPIFAGVGGGVGAPDSLVLGCTHFPALTETLREVVGPEVLIVDSARTTAEAVREELIKRHLARDGEGAPTIRLMATDSPARFARVAAHLIPRDILPDTIELIDL
jgi:glutamate racemase